MKLLVLVLLILAASASVVPPLGGAVESLKGLVAADATTAPTTSVTSDLPVTTPAPTTSVTSDLPVTTPAPTTSVKPDPSATTPSPPTSVTTDTTGNGTETTVPYWPENGINPGEISSIVVAGFFLLAFAVAGVYFIKSENFLCYK